MRKALLATVATAAVVPVAIASSLTFGSSPASAAGQRLEVVGLAGAGTKLVAFMSDRPTQSRITGTVRGLQGDRRLVGIDHRAADGMLYGLGDQGGIYTLARNGVATPFGQLTVDLEGTAFGVDVNPAADALRIVSDTGQNLRHAFATPQGPTAVDTRLSSPPTVGDTTGIVGAAYTNNDTSTDTATTLFDISTTTDQVLVQAPANSGTLSPTGSLTVDANGNAAFDIYSEVRTAGGVTTAVEQHAFATLRVGNMRGFFTVDLLTGKATRVGGLAQDVLDISVPLAQR